MEFSFKRQWITGGRNEQDRFGEEMSGDDGTAAEQGQAAASAIPRDHHSLCPGPVDVDRSTSGGFR